LLQYEVVVFIYLYIYYIKERVTEVITLNISVEFGAYLEDSCTESRLWKFRIYKKECCL